MKYALLIICLCTSLVSYAAVSNDECSNAITLSVDGSCQVYDNSTATRSSVPDFLCGWSGEGRDVWFSATVPSSGNLTVEINMVNGSSIGYEVIMELHEGTCGNLTPIACNHNKDNYNAWDPFPKIELTGRSAGEIIYIRVTGWNDNEGEFEICASDAYGSYPCRIDLMTLGAKGTCDPATNTFTQEVTVYYRHDGSTNGTISIMHNSFDISGSPQTETITLPANGSLLDMNSWLEGDWTSCTANSNYFNGGGIVAEDFCYSGTVVNDEPCNAIIINPTQGCQEFIGNNTGATTSVGGGVMDYFNCRYAGSNPQDVWYKFNMPASGRAVVNTYGVQEGVEAIFELYTGSCGSLIRYEGCLPEDSWKGPGTPWHSYHIDDLSSGTEVYVRVADDSGNAQGDFGICIIEPEAFTNDICSNAIDVPVSTDCDGKIYVMHPATGSSNPDAVISCDDQGKSVSEDVWFKVTVPSNGSFTIETQEIELANSDLTMAIYEGTCGGLVQLDCDQNSGDHGHPSINISGRSPGEVIFVRLSEWSDDQRSSFKICANSLANDACVGAINVPIGTCQTYNESGATPSDNPHEGFLCGWDGDANDVWFSAMVPPSGNLTVEINMINGGPYNMIMELHEGTCGNLSPLACSQNKNDYTAWQGYPKIELEGRTPGETIYIRATSGNDHEVPFEICVIDAGYNDPCKIELVVPVSQSACDPLSNTFTQDLEVYYRQDGTVNQFSINNQQFEVTGNYPQTVTVTLPAHGGAHNLNAQFDGDWNLCTANSSYSAAEVVDAPSQCVDPPINDEPANAIFLAVTQGCTEYIGNNTGATHSMGDGINYNFECEWAGSSPQDVWYTFEVPASGDVIINTYHVEMALSPLFEVYSTTNGDLAYIGGCAGAPWASLRFDDLASGAQLYVRVASSGGNAQGDFGICIIEPEPMINDICTAAIDVTVTSTCTGKIYSMHTASASNYPTPIHSCEDPNNNPSRDIWFKMTVPSNGILFISTENIERDQDNILMSLYEGECGNLTLIDNECIHSNSQNGHVSTALYSRSPGEVIYARVSHWGSYGDDRDYSALRICAVSPGVDNSAAFHQSDCYMDRHNTSLETSWLSCDVAANPNPNRGMGHWLLIELDSLILLEQLHLWNINHPDHVNSGARTIAIDIMDSNNEWQFLEQITVTKANGSGFYEGEIIELQNQAPTDKLLFTITDNYGGPCAGLSEVELGYSDPMQDIINEDCLNAIDLQYPMDNVIGFSNITYRTDETITGDNLIQSDGILTLDAKQGVLLNPGFEVGTDAILQVFLDGCDGGTASSASNNTNSDSIYFLGAGTTDGLTVSASSSTSETTVQNCIDGSGMDAEFMLASRFLAQSTLGFEESHVDEVMQMGFEAWIDQQMQIQPSYYLNKTLTAFEYFRQLFLDNTPNPSETDLFAISEANTWRDFYSVWWTIHEDNDDLLRQRIALALSEIFVISTNVDAIADDATGVADYYDMLLDHSFGNFRDLLEDVALHAVMGQYLGHLNNPKSDPINNTVPDENFAREIMQLFSIGVFELNPDGTVKNDGNGNPIQTYNNGHIKELAKVFTGLGGSAWGQRNIDQATADGYTLTNPPGFGYDLYGIAGDAPMTMYEEWHEQGSKTIIGDQVIPTGQTGMQDIDMALDILFNHDNVGPFIGKQLIQRLVKSNPSEDYVERITNVFNDNGSGIRGDLGAVVKAILLDEEARSCMEIQNPTNGKLREPLIKFLHFTRTLGRDPNINPSINYYSASFDEADIKQQPLRSPSVFNFFSPSYQPTGPIKEAGLLAPEFQIYDPQTAIGNANMLHGTTIWGNIFVRNEVYNGEAEYDDRSIFLDFSSLIELTDDEALINYLDRLFTHGRLSDRTRYIIREAIGPMSDWDPMYHNRESMALFLLLNSPDYNILK